MLTLSAGVRCERTPFQHREMALANLIFLQAKGRWIEKFLLPTGVDNIIVLLFKASGLAADATMKNYTTLADIIAGGSTEATFTNYLRQVLSASDIVVTFNSGTGVVTADCSDRLWAAAGGASNDTLGALVTAYRPTSVSADSAVLPLSKHDFTASTTGGNLTAGVPAVGTAT